MQRQQHAPLITLPAVSPPLRPSPPPHRKAAELSKVRGKLSCLVINDLDAGIGRFGNTQVGAAGGFGCESGGGVFWGGEGGLSAAGKPQGG